MPEGPEPPENIRLLLDKYRGGRIPPLLKDKTTEDGLLNGDFVEIYRHGMAHRGTPPLNLTPGGLLRPAEIGNDDPWETAEYIRTPEVASGWHSFCCAFRDREGGPGDTTCQKFDRIMAKIAADSGKTIAYLCHAGLIDLAAPVMVHGEPVAVFFSGQCWPSVGTGWNPEIVEDGGVFRPLREGERGVDAEKESETRFRRVRGSEGSLPHPTEGENPSPRLSPEDVVGLLNSFGMAASHLSRFSEQTVTLEKSHLVAWLRTEIARSLAFLTPALKVTTQDAWSHLLGCVRFVAEHFGFRAIAILGCLPSESRVSFAVWPDSEAATVHPLRSVEKTPKQVAQLRSSLRNEKLLFCFPVEKLAGCSELLEAIPGGAASTRCQALIYHDPFGTGVHPFAAILAWPARGSFSSPADMGGNQDACEEILRDLCLMADILLLVQERNQMIEHQDRSLEAVAHDIRNPVQTILMAAENALHGSPDPEQMRKRVERIVRSVRRVHALSQRVWTAQSIRLGEAPFEDTEVVKIWDIVSACNELLQDSTQKNDIKVTLKDVLKSLKPVRVNRYLFTQCVLNLLDNAIKYSDPKSEVRIDGRERGGKTELSFVNFGVGIPEHERERIFVHYYRSNKAKARVREGAGVGLSIVKAFADHYGAVEVKSEETREGWVTEFKLFLDPLKALSERR